MKEIPLKNSVLVALVDDDKYEELSKYEWRATQAWGDSWRATSGHDTYMHHLVIGVPAEGFLVDHKDRNGLNNQKDNLRITTKSVNTLNSKTRSDNSSGVKGVSYNNRQRLWRAYGYLNGKEKHLGYFASLTAATTARKQWELENIQ